MLIPLIFATSIISFILSFLALLLVLRISRDRSKEERLELKDNDAILISGCDSGIGLELAKYFYRTLKCKIICGLLTLKHESKGYRELLELKRSDEHQSDRIVLTQLNLTSPEDMANLKETIDKLKSDHGMNLFALINNAGVMTYGEFDWLTWNQIESQIDVNLTGTLRLTRTILPYILESKGRIINVSSVNDATVFPGLSIYSATKSAVSTFSRAIGYELRKFGVNVITIRLGDFARLTNIMSRHESHQVAMWEEMSAKKRITYKDYFHEFNGHLLKNYGMTSPRDFEDSNLFPDFKRALLSKRPPSIITCAPVGFRIFYFIIELLPIQLQNHLLDYLIQFGFRWKPPAVAVDTSSD